MHQIEAWVDRAASGHRSQPRRRPTHNVRGSSLSSGTRQPDDRCRRERGAAAVLIAPHARGAIQRSSARRRPPRTPKAAAGLGCSRIHLLHFFCPRSRVLSAMQVRRSFLVRRRAGSRASRRGKGAGRDCARARRKSEEGGGQRRVGRRRYSAGQRRAELEGERVPLAAGRDRRYTYVKIEYMQNARRASDARARRSPLLSLSLRERRARGLSPTTPAAAARAATDGCGSSSG